MKAEERERAANLTREALPVYTLLPIFAYVLDALGAFAESCGWVEVLVYLFMVEFCTFVDHYYVLHKWRHWKHDVHHFFKMRIDSIVCGMHPS